MPPQLPDLAPHEAGEENGPDENFGEPEWRISTAVDVR